MHRIKTLPFPLAVASLPLTAPAAFATEFTLLIHEAPTEFAKRIDRSPAGRSLGGTVEVRPNAPAPATP